MRITITDERTRWTLQTVAWFRGSSQMGGLDDLSTTGTESEDQYREQRKEAAERVAMPPPSVRFVALLKSAC